MTANPAKWVLARRQFAAVMIALVAIIGLAAFAAIPRTEDPVVIAPTFGIRAILPGTSPKDVEQQVTKPIEAAIYRVGGLRQVRSTTLGGVALTYVEFEWGTDPQTAFADLQRELGAARGTLPPGLAKLDVTQYRPSNVAIRVVALSSPTLSMRQLDKVARALQDKLAAVNGVREVKLAGGRRLNARVALDTTRLAALGLAPMVVAEALRAAGVETPIGDLDGGPKQFTLKYQGAPDSLDAIRTVPLVTGGAPGLTVADVADVSWSAERDSTIARYDGKRAILLGVLANDGQDITHLSPVINAQLDQFERTLPGGVTMKRGFDQADSVDRRLSRLARDFAIALVLVGIILLPIGLRAASVVMLAIPMSLLIGVTALYYLGYTLNQLSIAGFIIALGILVDDAIVVVENITRWLRNGHALPEAVVGGTGQIGLAVVGCTACLIFAFIPLAALSDISGAFIRSMPIAVFATVIGSFVVAFTLIPLASLYLLKRPTHPEGSRLLGAVNRAIHRFYAPMLRFALAAPRRTLAGLLALTTLIVPVVLIIGSSLFPVAGTNEFTIAVQGEQGSSLATTDAIIRRVEARVRGIAGLRWYSASVGNSGPRLYYNVDDIEGDPSYGEVSVGLRRWDAKDGAALLAALRRDLATIPGANITIKEFRQGPAQEAPVVVRISGPNLDQLVALARKAEDILLSTPGIADVNNILRRERTDMRLVVDEAALAARGVPAGTLRQTVQLSLSGLPVAMLRDDDGDAYPVVVRLPTEGRNTAAMLDRVFVPTIAGGAVPLPSVARLAAESGPATIGRLNRLRSVTLTANVAPDMLVSRVTDAGIARIRSSLALPPGYTVSLGGEAEAQSRSFATLLPAVAIALCGILAVLILEFGRFRPVAVVLGIVPFGILGGVTALLLTGNSLSFTATVGLIALIGIEIKNSILLVDFTEQLRAEGMAVREAVERAGELRFLPVLLTSVTAIGGMVPLAVEGNALYSPVALVLIGGLISSTVLARIATPVMYLLLAPRDGVR